MNTQDTDSENICNICCTSLLSDENTETILECNHKYHRWCIEKSLEMTKRKECPYCRAPTKYGPYKNSIKIGDTVIVNSTKYKNEFGIVSKVMSKMVRITLDTGIDANVAFKNVKIKNTNLKLNLKSTTAFCHTKHYLKN